jgi:hypothetical protein
MDYHPGNYLFFRFFVCTEMRVSAYLDWFPHVGNKVRGEYYIWQ